MYDNVELQATCAALGYLDGDKYYKEPDCLETVKDLIRFLKRDDDSCAIRRELGEMEILQKDLIPITKQYSDDRILLETVTRLMVNLTQPAKLCFQNQVPEDKTMRNYYLQIESHLQLYKEAFADEKLLAVFTVKLGDLLQLDWEHRQEEDRLLVERILIVLRNILHVPPNVERELRTDDDVSIHDQVLWAFHISGMEDLLLYLASSDDERQFMFHVLEIISLMFREQSAEQLASAGVRRAETEKQNDKRELEMALEKEKLQRQAIIMKCRSRHSTFGGTFVVQNMKSISDKNLIYHQGLTKDIQFGSNKVPRKRPRNRKPIVDAEVTRRSTLSIRIFLKEFCVQFLENCYNTIMHSIKDSLLRSKAQENDETYYLWAMRYFMEFNRRLNFQVALVSETMSVATFHYIQTHLQNYHEMILTNRKEGIVWSRRMHLALKAYYELLLNIIAMDASTDPSIHESSKVIKSNVFYMMEYRDIFVLLLKKFDETRQSRLFLRDLIEANHVFLRMLEQYSKQHSHLVVQKKKHRVGHRRKKKPAHQVSTVERTREELENIWDEVSGDMSALLQGRGDIPEGILPFDAASEVDIEQQRVDAVFKIQDYLRNKKPGEAIALMRNAREVWPGRAEFGLPEISAEDEFMALREIFFTELPGHARTEANSTPVQESSESSEDEINEEEREMRFATVEQEFSFQEFILRFASPQVIKCYVILLAEFRTNSQMTNHSIVKMLHRIAFDCHLIGLLFQARLFRVFSKILTDPFCSSSYFEELRTFSRHILRKFFEVAQTNKKVFVELFFWKNSKEALEITEGYGSIQRQGKVKQTWREEEDDELRQLFNQYKDNLDPGKDLVDEIMAHMIDQRKTRRQVLRQLVHLDLIGSAKDLKVRSGRSNQLMSRTWREEEEMELRQLFDQYRESNDPLGEIIPNLMVARSKPKVIEKILELGLVSDRKELRKKRQKGRGRGGSGREGNNKRKRKAAESSNNEDSSNGSPSNSDNSDAENSDHGTREFGNEAMLHPGESSRKTKRDSTPPSNGASESEVENSDEPLYVVKIRCQVKKVIENGLKTAVDWLKNCLTRTADDRDEEDDSQAIPIVPITEEQEEAMENPAFCQLLKKCGVKPPANEQERFWRIPGSLTSVDLRCRTAALIERPSLFDQSLDQKVQSSRINKRLDLFKGLLQTKNLTRETRVSASETVEDDQNSGGEDEDVRKLSDAVEKRQSLKRTLQSDSDVSSDNERLVIDEGGRASARPTSKKRRRLSSDEEKDEGAEETTPPFGQLTDDGTSKAAADATAGQSSIDGLHTFPATVMSRVMSDSDLDDHVPLMKGTKKRNKVAIASDSDDE